MRSRSIAALCVAGAGLLAACGQSAGSATQHASTVHVGHTSLGDVLVDANGRTLYGFTNDVNGTSSCNGTCTLTWPPLEANSGWTAGSPLQSSAFHTVMRTDGKTQLATAKWPLYVFAGDRAPGDVNGEGSLGKWFVVRPDGTLLKNSSAVAPTTVAPTTYGGGY